MIVKSKIFCKAERLNPYRESTNSKEVCKKIHGFPFKACHCFFPPAVKHNFFYSIVNLILTHFPFWFDCEADMTKCQKERRTALGPLGDAPPGRFAPECDDSGQYNRMQCYSAIGYCWCVDSLGREIPGTRNKGRVSCPDKGLNFILFTTQREKER